jgi:hypothetical protein
MPAIWDLNPFDSGHSQVESASLQEPHVHMKLRVTAEAETANVGTGMNNVSAIAIIKTGNVLGKYIWNSLSPLRMGM